MSTSETDSLARAEAAYASGDFATVRVLSAALGASTDAELAGRARALGTRVTTDVAIWIALGASLAFFIGIVVAYAT